MSINECDGNKWVSAQQVGEAIGTKRIARLVYELRDLGEIKEKKHYCTLTGLNSGVGRPDKLMLSYRGIIRVAMRSQGTRARQFRDWAEDVLFEVMMTGQYSVDRVLPDAIRAARCEGVRQGLALSTASSSTGIPVKTAAKILKYRRAGMTQREAGAAYGLSRWRVQDLERALKEAGIKIPPVNVRKRDREVMENIDQILLGPEKAYALLEGGAQ